MIKLPSPAKLSKKDIKAFKRDGVVCLRGVISPEEIETLRKDVDAQIGSFGHSPTGYDFQEIASQVWSEDQIIDVHKASRFDMSELRLILDYDKTARPNQDEDISPAAEGDGMFFYDAAGWRSYAGIREVAMDSALPELITQLLNTTRLNFWEDTTFVKSPNTAQRTTFHQDYAYFQIEGEKCCIVWIPLDPADSENGTMEYVRGSHHWQEIYAPNVFIGQSPHPYSPYERLPDIEGSRDKYDIISFDVEPGDVIIHHVMTIHGSGGNASCDRMRRALSFRYCGDDIAYCDRPGAIVQPYLLEKPSDGSALFSLDYPLVWPRPFPGAKISKLFEDMTLKGAVSQQGQFDASQAPETLENFKDPLIAENRPQEKIWDFGKLALSPPIT